MDPATTIIVVGAIVWGFCGLLALATVVYVRVMDCS